MLNNQITNNGFSENEKKLYEELLHAKEAQIKNQSELIDYLKNTNKN